MINNSAYGKGKKELFNPDMENKTINRPFVKSGDGRECDQTMTSGVISMLQKQWEQWETPPQTHTK